MLRAHLRWHLPTWPALLVSENQRLQIILHGQATPAEATGIQVQGNNKFLTLIQAAARSYDPTT